MPTDHTHGHSAPVLPAGSHAAHAHAPSHALRYQVHVIRRRWWLVTLIALTVLAGAWWRSRNQIPQYTAELRLQKQPDRDLLEAGWAGFYDLTPEAINAQIQVMQGQLVLDPVIDTVAARLALDPQILRSEIFSDVSVSPQAPEGSYSLRAAGREILLVNAGNQLVDRKPRGGVLVGPGFMLDLTEAYNWAEPVGFRIIPRDDALVLLQSGLRVDQLKGSMTLSIRYTSADPVFSRDVANAVGRSYTWYTGRRARQEASSRRQALQQRLDALADSLRRAQQELRAVDQIPVRSGAAVSIDAVSTAVLEATNRLLDLQFRRAQLVDLRGILQRGDPDGIQRAVALSEMLPGIHMQYQKLLDLQRQRIEYLRQSALATTSREVATFDSAIAAVRLDVSKLTSAQLETTNAMIENTQQRVQELRGDFATITSRLAETDALRQQTDAIQRVYADLSQMYYEAAVNEQLEASTVDVLAVARTPTTADGSRKTRSFIFALLVGTILGILAAFVLEQMDTRVRDAEDAQRAAAVGVIGMIPELRGDSSRPLAIKADDHTIGAEAYRKLRTNLRFLRAERPRVIAVTSPSPDEGKSVTAANLALAIAQQGQEVLIVDGDLRRPVQHEIFGVERGAGLSDALVGLVDPFDVIQDYSELENIHVMTCGTEAPNPAELLGSESFVRLLKVLLGRFDTIVIDTPPVNLVTDAAVIGSVTDGVLLVAEAGRTDRSVLTNAVNELRQARGSVLGIVLNRVAPGGRYGRYGGYYSGQMYYKRDLETESKNGNRLSAIKEWISALV
jgi:succinoglycan biosynthesis transport protein ExoP